MQLKRQNHSRISSHDLVEEALVRKHEMQLGWILKGIMGSNVEEALVRKHEMQHSTPLRLTA